MRQGAMTAVARHWRRCRAARLLFRLGMQTELFRCQVGNQSGNAFKRYRIADELGQFLITLGPTVDFDAAVTHAVPLT